jgi:hypothetical protein
MAEEIIGLKVELDTSGASAPMASLKSQIKEATKDLINFTDKFGATSKEAINAAKRVAELKDRMGDARQMVDAFNPDAKFNALTQAISGAANAFSAVQGAMGLFGVESANTEKALLKVQSAMAFSQGLSSFLDGGIEGFKNLYRQIAGPVVESFSTLKGALISTGIGALVVLLGLAIANFDELSVAIGLTTSAEQALKSISKDVTKGMEDVYKNVNSVNDAMVKAKAGVISKKDALKTYNDTLGDSLGHTNNFNQAEKNLRDKTPAYLAAMQARITMQVAMAKIAELQAKIATNKGNDLGFVDTSVKTILSLFGKVGTEQAYTLGAIKDQNEGYNTQIEALKKIAEQKAKEAEAEDKRAGINTNATTNATPEQKKKTAEKKQGKTDIEILKEKYASELLAAQEFHLTNIELEETYEKKKLAITEKYLKTKLATNDQTHVELLNAQREINNKLRELNKEIEEEAPEKDPKVVKAKEVVQLLLDTEGNYIQEKDSLYYQDRQKLLLNAKNQLEIIKGLRINSFENEVQKIKQEAALKYDIIKGNKAAEIALEEDTAAKIAALRQSVINQNIDAYMQAATSINSILSQSNANQLADLEANSQARIAAAGGNKEAILAIENETAIEKNRLQNEQVKRDKLFAIAEAIINTYKAAAQVFARPAPGDPVTSLGIKIASMVAAVASGIANVMAIRKVPLPSGGGGGGDVSGGSAPNSPMGTVFNTITKLNKDSIDKINDKAVKAYVVETDINNGQKRIERILINTKFK